MAVPPTSQVLDDFVRADQSPLGLSSSGLTWETLGGSNAFQIVANSARPVEAASGVHLTSLPTAYTVAARHILEIRAQVVLPGPSVPYHFAVGVFDGAADFVTGFVQYTGSAHQMGLRAMKAGVATVSTLVTSLKIPSSTELVFRMWADGTNLATSITNVPATATTSRLFTSAQFTPSVLTVGDVGFRADQTAPYAETQQVRATSLMVKHAPYVDRTAESRVAASYFGNDGVFAAPPPIEQGPFFYYPPYVWPVEAKLLDPVSSRVQDAFDRVKLDLPSLHTPYAEADGFAIPEE